MSAFDVLLSELGSTIRSLPRRSLVALFWACSTALLEEFLRWAAHYHQSTEQLLRDTLNAAYKYAVFGTDPLDATRLLRSLEESSPSGESPDDFSSTAAQDCWICADVSIRVIVDPSYDAGPAIEYALEPVVSATTEELFGVSQLGSGPELEETMSVVLEASRVVAAVTFLRWALVFLSDESGLSEENLALLRSHATALTPPVS